MHFLIIKSLSFESIFFTTILNVLSSSKIFSTFDSMFELIILLA